MRITFNPQNFCQSKLNNYNQPKKNAYSPAFTSYKDIGMNTHCTNFCRGDLNWDEFASFLRLKFLRTDKVNSVILGGSDGSEAYTYVMNMMKFLGDEAKKFFPVKSIEMSSAQHSIAESGKIPLLKDKEDAVKETKRIYENIGDKQGEYFKIINGSLVVMPEIKKQIIFKNIDLVKELPEIPLKNSVVMMRNTWNYLNDAKKFEVAKFLSKLEKSSVFVNGAFDYQWDCTMKFLLKDLNFEYTPVDHVFVKVR